jgi:hypothetical protein
VAVSTDQRDQVQLRLDPSVLLALRASMQLRIVINDAPTSADEGAINDPGTSAAQPLAAPFDLRLVTFDLTSGQPAEVPAGTAGSLIEVRLPLPVADLAPGDEVTWLMELVGPSGEFLGYVRPPSHLDPATQQLVLEVRADQLRGTLFLPVIWHTAYVRNFDPAVRIWSGPFADAVDFGVAAPQWTRMQILAPRLGGRLLVLNAFTGEPGWVDSDGVGPVAADDGLAAVPATDAAAGGPTSEVVLDTPPAARAGLESTYTVQPGDSLKMIAAQVDSTVDRLWAANPDINPDSLVIGRQLLVPAATP